MLNGISKILALPFIALAVIWNRFISPFLGEHCRFYPSCSCYSREALEKYGLFRGLLLTVGRVFRCNPWCKGGVDPVP